MKERAQGEPRYSRFSGAMPRGEVRQNPFKSNGKGGNVGVCTYLRISQLDKGASARGAALFAIFGRYAPRRGSLKHVQIKREGWECGGIYSPKDTPS